MTQNSKEDLTFAEVADRYLASLTRHGEKRDDVVVRVTNRLKRRYRQNARTSYKLMDIDWLEERFNLPGELRTKGDKFARRSRPYGKPLSKAYSEAYINKYMVIINSIFKVAAEMGYPFSLVPMQKMPERKREIYLQPDQVSALAESLDPLRAAMVRFGFQTGLRISGVLTMTWDMVDFGDRMVYYRGFQTKNRKPFACVLNDFALRILEERRAWTDAKEAELRSKPDLLNPEGITEIPYVFAKDENRWEKCTPLSRQAVKNKHWKMACQRLKIDPKASFHTLRHSFASHHANAGTNPNELKTLGGWNSLNSVERYAHFNKQRLELVVHRVATEV
tara:strand:+ start:1029 stop:2033 length:1005 start_codon:yes stop_codon:yes gene_type:complete